MAMTTCHERKKEISDSADKCPHCGSKPRKVGIGTVLLIVLGLIVVMFMLGKQSDPPNQSVSSAPTPKQSATQLVSLKSFSWSKGGFDSIMMLTALIENKSAFTVRDIEITCEHSGNSGTVVGRSRKIAYETVQSGKNKQLKDFNMGFIHSQAVRSRCFVTDLSIQ